MAVTKRKTGRLLVEERRRRILARDRPARPQHQRHGGVMC
jgi:hypothetical protein